MASPTATKKYSRQLVLILSQSMDDIITKDASEMGISRAEAARAFIATGMRQVGYEPQAEDTPAAKETAS